MASRSRKVDLNTAPLSALLRMPQVGPALARAIMAARPYRRISDLKHVSGVGEKLYFILKVHVSVSQRAAEDSPRSEGEAAPPASAPSAKLDLNSATVQELTALPGVGQALAEAIVTGRPYGRLPELRRVSGVGAKLYAALRRHLRVPRASLPIPAPEPTMAEPSQIEAESAAGPAAEIERMPSFEEDAPAEAKHEDDANIPAAQSGPLEVETVQELIGPPIVDGRAPPRIDPAILEGAEAQPTRLVTRELRRDWKSVEIEIGPRPRGIRWRLLGTAMIAALILSVLQAYGLFGDAITPAIFSPPATKPAIAPTQVTPSATSTQSGAQPTLTVVAVAVSATSVPAAIETSPAATVEAPTATATATSEPTVEPTPTPTASAFPASTATREIAIPQSVRDLDPPVTPVAVLWTEDFEPPQFPWGYERNEFWDSGIVEGVLRLNMKQRGTQFYSTGPAFHLAERDFFFEGDVIVEACTGKDYYGLVFKARLPNYYAATITCEGNYRLVRRQNDVHEDLIVAVSDAVPEGPGVYRLGVLLQGDGFSLYVNGTNVDRLPVEGLGEVAAGEFGVFARSVESHQLQLEWDNLTATELQR